MLVVLPAFSRSSKEGLTGVSQLLGNKNTFTLINQTFKCLPSSRLAETSESLDPRGWLLPLPLGTWSSRALQVEVPHLGCIHRNERESGAQKMWFPTSRPPEFRRIRRALHLWHNLSAWEKLKHLVVVTQTPPPKFLWSLPGHTSDKLGPVSASLL